jgi:hypothetical protein
MTDDLEKRITAALSADPSSELEALIVETENAIIEATEAATLTREWALDPTVSPDATAARAAMDGAWFRVERLETVLPRLQRHFEKNQKREELRHWKRRYDELEPLRDALAQEILEVYPAYVASLADLMLRASAFERAASDLHRDRPAGVKLHLDSPELIARGIQRFDREHPSLSDNLKLPEFESGSRLVFPPPRERAMPRPLPYEPRYSPQWHDDARERARARIEEGDRAAEYFEKAAERGEKA